MADELIFSGRVIVDGQSVKNPGIIVSEKNIVEIDGKQIKPKLDLVYIMFNKPKLVITSKYDNEGRETIMEYLPDNFQHLNPVGRLDFDASGLLLLTNDGELINKLTHPRYEAEKTYVVKCEPPITKLDLDYLTSGVEIATDLISRADDVELKNDTLLLTIHEGHYHHVKRMMEAINKKVVWLKRVSFKGVNLGDLPPGRWRYLTNNEVSKLKS